MDVFTLIMEKHEEIWRKLFDPSQDFLVDCDRTNKEVQGRFENGSVEVDCALLDDMEFMLSKDEPMNKSSRALNHMSI